MIDVDGVFPGAALQDLSGDICVSIAVHVADGIDLPPVVAGGFGNDRRADVGEARTAAVVHVALVGGGVGRDEQVVVAIAVDVARARHAVAELRGPRRGQPGLVGCVADRRRVAVVHIHGAIFGVDKVVDTVVVVVAGTRNREPGKATGGGGRVERLVHGRAQTRCASGIEAGLVEAGGEIPIGDDEIVVSIDVDVAHGANGVAEAAELQSGGRNDGEIGRRRQTVFGAVVDVDGTDSAHRAAMVDPLGEHEVGVAVSVEVSTDVDVLAERQRGCAAVEGLCWGRHHRVERHGEVRIGGVDREQDLGVVAAQCSRKHPAVSIPCEGVLKDPQVAIFAA